MKRFIPVPGDLIVVEFSEWYALRDGERLRVCENTDWLEVGEELYVAPRLQVSTFWGPEHGPPDGYKPFQMSTSGGPFKTVKIKDLEGLELIGEEDDTFWCWQDSPRAAGGKDRTVRVALWRLSVLPDSHYRELKQFGLKTHRNDTESVNDIRSDPAYEPIMSITNGCIRLGCKMCERSDFDYAWELPDDWRDIQLCRDQAIGVWLTHLGICPSCQESMRESPDPIVRQIIDRDCHVATPSRDVVRHVISKLRYGYDTWRSMSQTDRDMLVEQSVRHHRRNLKEYVEVMSGFTLTTERDLALLPTQLSGMELASLMRKHKKTVGALAFRLGTTRKRIREVRRKGLTEVLAIRDWLQAITGEDPGPIPNQYRIANREHSAECGYCGCPLITGDDAHEYLGEVFCSITCCRKSRGW